MSINPDLYQRTVGLLFRTGLPRAASAAAVAAIAAAAAAAPAVAAATSRTQIQVLSPPVGLMFTTTAAIGRLGSPLRFFEGLDDARTAQPLLLTLVFRLIVVNVDCFHHTILHFQLV